jgi:hypothetical protein
MTRAASGFTLIEMLISFTIMVVVVLELGRIQGIAAKLLARSRRMSVDVSRVRGSTVLTADCRAFLTPGWLTASDPAISLTRVDSAGGSKGSLTFYVVQYEPLTTPCLGKVTYSITDAGLVREFVPALPAGDETTALAQTSVLVAGATGLDVQLHDGTRFVQDWTGHVGLPYGVKMKVTFPLGAAADGSGDGGHASTGTFVWVAAFKEGTLTGS